MSSQDDQNFPVIARYKLNDGREISLRRKDLQGVPNGAKSSQGDTGGRKASTPIPQRKRPSLAPRSSSVSVSKTTDTSNDKKNAVKPPLSRKQSAQPASASPAPLPSGQKKRPSLAPRQSSVSVKNAQRKPLTNQKPNSKDAQEKTSTCQPGKASTPSSAASSQAPQERPCLPPRKSSISVSRTRDSTPGTPGSTETASKEPAGRRGSTPAPSAFPQQKRPSLAPRQSSLSVSKTRRAPSEVSSVGSRDRPPKLPPRPPSKILNMRRPSDSSSASRDRPPKLGPRRASAVGSDDSSAFVPSPRRVSGLKRASSQAEGAARERPSVSSRTSSKAQVPSASGRKSVDTSSTRPSMMNRQTSSAPESKSERSPVLARSESSAQNPVPDKKPISNQALSKPTGPNTKNPPTTSETPGAGLGNTQDPKSMQPPTLDRSTSQAQESAPKRPSLAPKKSSRKVSTPGVRSPPSGRRVSFQEDERGLNPTPTPNDSSKLPNVTEEDPKRPKAPLRKSSATSKASESQKKTCKTSTRMDKESQKPGKESQATGGSKEKSETTREAQTPDDTTTSKRPPVSRQFSTRTKPIGNPSGPAEGSNKTPKSSKSNDSEKAPSQKKGPPPSKDQGGQPDDKSIKENQDDRDLKSILSEEQCGDLTLLIADIAKQMRRDIESHYDPYKGLKLIKDDDAGDGLENIDFDPGTVDVAEYDKERKLLDVQEKELARPENKKLKDANLHWFDEWREVVILRVGEAVNSKETASDQKGAAAPQTQERRAQPIQKFEGGTKLNANIGPKLEELFPRIKTPLTKLPMNKRVLVLHSMLLLLLSLEHYNAASRVLLLYLTTSLKLGLSSLRGDEEKTAQGLLKAAKQMSADEEASKRLEESNNTSRKWKIRLASAAGAAVIGYTGGLAAPMIAAGLGSVMGELGLGATAAAGYLGTVASNTAVVGTLFGAYGGSMTGKVMENISAGVQDFGFLPIHGERKEHEDSVSAVTNTRRLRVIIAISGWLLEKEEVVTPWRVLKPSAEVFALRFELETLLNLGQSFDTMLQSAVYGYAQSTMIKQTVFSEVMSGMMWPMALTKVARVVDNPFSLAQTRADKAGQVLADALINHVQGERPVTLIGYSLGARVIWSCLTSLAKRKAFGLVESAVLMGAPIPSDTNTWRSMRSAVSGRLVNVYSENDYLLAFLYRTSSLQYGVAGLVPVTDLPSIENVDVTEQVSGHLRYRYLVGSILQKLRFEDVDKDEVAKETKAFDAIVEEEKQRTYLQQAGDLYENYKGKKPAPKKKASKDKQINNISDADAEKQVSAMEKTVDEKTQTSLMQWAVEQLYLSSPSTDKAKAKAAEEAKKASSPPVANAQTTPTKPPGSNKSYYQWAKEATYLSRSGGPEGEQTHKAKQNQAQEASPQAEEEQQAGYLSSAAGYIPTGYVPTLRGSSTGGKDKDSKKEENAEKPTETNVSKHLSEGSAVEEATGYTSYLPSFGMGGSSEKGKGKEKETQEGEDGEGVSAEEAQEKAAGAHASHSSNGEETGQETGGEGTADEETGQEETADEANKGQAENTGEVAAHEESGEEGAGKQDVPEKGKQEDTPEEEDGTGQEETGEEDVGQSVFTTDTEGGGGTGTDEDPFVTPSDKGVGDGKGTKFTDAARASGGAKSG